jgi:predicted RNA methylase
MSSERLPVIEIVQRFHRGGAADDRELERALRITQTGESRIASLTGLLRRFGNQNFTFQAASFRALRDIFSIIKPAADELFCDAGAGYGHAVFYGACVASCRFRAIEILPTRCHAMRKTAGRLGLDRIDIVQGDAMQQSYADVSYLLLNSPFFPQMARRFVDHLATACHQPLTVIAMNNIVDAFRSAAGFNEIDVAADLPPYSFGVFRSRGQ